MNILGLDLGVASIGWALIDINDMTYQPEKLLGLGSRIVNLSVDENKAFNSSGETPCAQRTSKRTARKMIKRRKQRVKNLRNYLHQLGMFDRNTPLNTLSSLEIWGLRANAADPDCKLSLYELGRVILHLSRKRGYKHSRLNSNNKKETEYVSQINRHYSELKDSGLTLGQYFYKKLKESETITPDKNGKVVTYRIKQDKDSATTNLLPREAHKEELIQILNAQRTHYPDILTDKVIAEISDIIFYQRPLKSCKNLVGRCEMFDFQFRNANGKIINSNPRVSPRTSPVAQFTRIWETVNNILLINHRNKVTGGNNPVADIKSRDYRKTLEKFELTEEERQRVAEYLMTNEKLTTTELLKLLGLKRSDGFKLESNITTGIKGNKTYVDLFKALEGQADRDDLLKFEPKISEVADKDTGEIHLIVDSDIINEPLYRLWHLIYSISDPADLRKSLTRQFNITDDKILDALVNIDFKKDGFSNRSVKFMRLIIPYLMQGCKYSEACEKAGFRHSDYLTAEENENRVLADSIDPLHKGELRQPLVEKVLNQMINIVNDIICKYGPIDEIRVELARELKQSKDQRIKATNDIAAAEKRNEKIAELIRQYEGVKVNRRTIQKYRMWEETEHRCIYCNQPVNVAAFLSGELSEVEHIIPRSLYFDDSFSNKTCSCSQCNKSKGQLTAYDFMEKKGTQYLIDFQKRVEELAENNKISRTKLKYFLTSAKDIPQDFINRDLQQTRYISRKAMEVLRAVAKNVYASSGTVTDFFRNAWGYNRLLENLNIDRYEKAGMVEHNGSRKTIKEWTKRLDHRHHAVDALTVALTRQNYIQRLNTLNASRDSMRNDVGDKFSSAYSLLEQWAVLRPHFSPDEVMKKLDEVSVSFKPGKKSTTTSCSGHNKKTVKVPRGPLHEDTIYGCIYVIDDKPKKISDCVKNPDIIASPKYRKMVSDLVEQNDGDTKSVIKYLKSNPLCSPTSEIIETLTTRHKEYVKRESLLSLKATQIDNIVDPQVKAVVRQRFEECGRSEKAFYQSIAEHPLYLNSSTPYPIKRITRATGLKENSVVAVRMSDNRPIGYAKTGNNHHSAFYITPDNNILEYCVSLWTTVKRQKLGLPAVITNPAEAAKLMENMPLTSDVKEVLDSLPPCDSTLLFTLAINDMVILGLDDDEYNNAIETNDIATLTSHLYRVQAISLSYYEFRHHTHTLTTKDDIAMSSGNYIRLQSWSAMCKSNIRKVTVDRLGNIII